MTPSRSEPRSADTKAREIAGKIHWDDPNDLEIIDIIAAALRDIVEEAHQEWLTDQCLDDVAKRAYAQGFSDCRERAAKLFSCWQPRILNCQCGGCEFPKAIRAITPSEGGTK